MNTRPLADLAPDWPQLSRLLDEALQLPEAERLPWLNGHAGVAAPLKDTLRRLLGNPAAAETGDFMHTLPGSLRAPRGEGGPQPGDTVGPWRLMRLLGEGGMGSVFLAERADGSLKRPVALKLPRLGWARGLAERMARERDILATLEHPRIARLYDAGVDASGRPWLALEFVQGRPIDTFAREQGLAVRERVALLLQVCEAVAHAHGRLVIHRDLKPGNILVTDEGQVRLLDFGIAKLLSADRAEATALTRLAGPALTLDYASPEQVRGAALGTASDVYSLGVVAYELLSGQRPYKLRRGSAAELEEAIMGADVAPASRAAQDTAHAAALRGDLDAILQQALRKDPAARYPTVDALAQDLQRHLQGLPVAARPDRWHYRARKWAARHPVPLAVAGGVLLALLGGAHAQAAVVLALAAGVLVALWQRREALRQAERARAEGEAARRENERAEAEIDAQRAVRDMYIEAFSTLSVKAQTDAAALSRPHAVARVLEDTMDACLPRDADTPHSQLALLDVVATQLNYTNDFERSAAIAERYIAELKAQGAPADRVIMAFTTLGSSLYHLGRLDDCERVRREGVAWAAGEHGWRTEGARMRLVIVLARLLDERGQRQEAVQLLQRADTVTARDYADSNVRWECLRALAVHHAGYDPEASLRHARQQAQLQHAAGREAPEERANAQSQLAQSLLALGQAQAAEAPAREALALNARLYGRHGTKALLHLRLLVQALARQGRCDEALALVAATEGEAAAEHDAAAAQAVAATARTCHADIAWLQGSVPGGALAQDRLTRLDDTGAARPLGPALLQRLEAQALAALEAGHDAEAAASALELEAALRRGQGAAPVDTWSVAVALEVQALVLLKAGDAAAAAALLARRAALRVPAPSDVELAESLLRQADAEALRGDAAAAADLARAALERLQGQHPASPRLQQARRHLPAG